MMRHIFSYAERMFIWLNEASDDSQLAFETLQVFVDENSACSRIPPERCSAVWDRIYKDHMQELEAVRSLVERQWWRRVWVLQEVAL